MDLLAHPLVQSAVLPGLAALALLALGRFGPFAGIVAATATLGVLACLVAAMGTAPWPPRSGLHKVVWLLALASVLAPLLAAKVVPSRATGLASVVFVVGALLWLAWPQLVPAALTASVLFVLGAAAALVIQGRLARPASSPAAGAAMLGVASLGLAVTAVLSSSLILGQLGGALATVAGILFLWHLAIRRHGSGDDGTAALRWGGICLALLAALVVLLTEAPAWFLVPLPFSFFADGLVGARVPAAWRPLTVAAVALVPVLVMVAVTVLLAGSGADDAYYRR